MNEFQNEYVYENDNKQQTEHHTLYTHNNKHPVRTKGNQSHQWPFQCGNYQQPNCYHQNYQQQNNQQPQPLTNSNWRNPKPTVQRKNIPKTGHKPIDKNGIQTRCKIRQSINNWSQNCLDKINTEHNTYIANKVGFHQTDFDSPQELNLYQKLWVQPYSIKVLVRQFVVRSG